MTLISILALSAIAQLLPAQFAVAEQRLRAEQNSPTQSQTTLTRDDHHLKNINPERFRRRANESSGSSDSRRSTSAKSSKSSNPVSTGGSARSDDASLGAAMLHTHPINHPQPLTVADAEAQGYTRVEGVGCHLSLGIEYAPAGGVSPEAPLSAYYTPAGQLCGLKLTIFHVDGPAAGGSMISEGYYVPVEVGRHPFFAGFYEEMFEISVSFRGAADVCSGDLLADAIGDRLVINQHTIAVSIPMTRGEAEKDGFQPGSCMTKMGQHYFKDLTSGSTMSFKTGNLLPVTPMYVPVDDPAGKLNAFMFTWPDCQVDHSPFGAWDEVPFGLCALTSALMCLNFCNPECGTSHFMPYAFTEPDVSRYGTYHVFLYGEGEGGAITCPPTSKDHGLFGRIAGRTCPSNTLTPDDP